MKLFWLEEKKLTKFGQKWLKINRIVKLLDLAKNGQKLQFLTVNCSISSSRTHANCK